MASAGSRPVPARKVNSTWLGPNSTSMERSGRPRSTMLVRRISRIGIHLVVALLGQVLVALVQQRHVGRLARLAGLACVTDAELALLQLEEMELDFQAGDEVVAAVGQRLQRALVDMARVERHRPAVGEEDVAQHPARVRRPGQGAEGGGIGQHQHVGRALQLLHAEAARPAARPGTPCGARCPSTAWWPRSRRRSSARRRSRSRQASCRAARRAGRRRPAARPTSRRPGCGARPRASPSCVRPSRDRPVRRGSCGLRHQRRARRARPSSIPLRRCSSNSFQ